MNIVIFVLLIIAIIILLISTVMCFILFNKYYAKTIATWCMIIGIISPMLVIFPIIGLISMYTYNRIDVVTLYGTDVIEIEERPGFHINGFDVRNQVRVYCGKSTHTLTAGDNKTAKITYTIDPHKLVGNVSTYRGKWQDDIINKFVIDFIASKSDDTSQLKSELAAIGINVSNITIETNSN